MGNSPTRRIFDLTVLLLTSWLWVPLTLLVAVCVRCFMGSPVIFSQQRTGLNGKLFRLRKFRTMRDARDAAGNLLPDHLRITPFARLLRASSLDELPGLLNVLRGDMSLVGPRPLLPEYLSLYSAEQARRHLVKPGVTGWAQINGRNQLSWERKFEYDVWYVDHRSLWLDIRILLLTVARVFRAEGISQAGHATAEKFRGSSG